MYQFIVQKSHICCTFVRMTVLDANDNAPLFLTNTFEGFINETASRGTVVLQLMARDDDIGNNGLVRLKMFCLQDNWFAL